MRGRGEEKEGKGRKGVGRSVGQRGGCQGIRIWGQRGLPNTKSINYVHAPYLPLPLKMA